MPRTAYPEHHLHVAFVGDEVKKGAVIGCSRPVRIALDLRGDRPALALDLHPAEHFELTLRAIRVPLYPVLVIDP